MLSRQMFIVRGRNILSCEVRSGRDARAKGTQAQGYDTGRPERHRPTSMQWQLILGNIFHENLFYKAGVIQSDVES